MRKLFTIEFKTIHGNRIIKEIKANSVDEAHDKLVNKYNIAFSMDMSKVTKKNILMNIVGIKHNNRNHRSGGLAWIGSCN